MFQSTRWLRFESSCRHVTHVQCRYITCSQKSECNIIMHSISFFLAHLHYVFQGCLESLETFSLCDRKKNMFLNFETHRMQQVRYNDNRHSSQFSSLIRPMPRSRRYYFSVYCLEQNFSPREFDKIHASVVLTFHLVFFY